MPALEIRPMTEADLPRAAELASEAGWRNRDVFYRLVLTVPSCRPLVGTVDGVVVAGGVATVSGSVGWVGSVVVGRSHRGLGYGRAMTEAVCDALHAAGCQTLLLIATALGQPVYEKMGFRVQTPLHVLHGDHTPDSPEARPGTKLRPVDARDLPAIFALDAVATGEDRSSVLAALAANGGHVLEDARGLRAFLLPSDRGYSPIVAPDREDGIFLAELHRHLAPQGSHARAGTPTRTEPAF